MQSLKEILEQRIPHRLFRRSLRASLHDAENWLENDIGEKEEAMG